MNRIKRSIALLLVIILCGAVLPAANAATSNVKLHPGDESAVVTFTVEDIYSLYGTFSVSDPDGIVTGWSAKVADRGGMNGGNVNGDTCYMYETSNPAKARNVKLEVTLKISKAAAVGDTAKVTFDYEKGIELSGMDIKTTAETAEVSVVVVSNTNNSSGENNTTQPTTGDDDDTTKPTTGKDDDTTKPTAGKDDDTTKPTAGKDDDTTQPTTAPVDTEGGNKGNKPSTNNNNSSDKNNNSNGNTTSTTKPTESDGKVNYDELKEAIETAKGFKEAEVDPEDWEALQELLEKAEDALDSEDQDEVNKAAKDLAAKNREIIGLDTSKLVAAMDKAAQESDKTALSGLWYQMHDELNNAKALLDLGNDAAQSDVDAVASRIEALIAEIEKEVAASVTEPGTMVEQVPVEVNPDEDFCNIGLHKLWPILFFVSLALNIGFAAIIIVYFVRKKKNQKDDTPLVDYDIDDDELDDLDDLDDELEAVE